MARLRLVATTGVELKNSLQDTPQNWLKNRLQRGAPFRARTRALPERAALESRNHFPALSSPTRSFNAVRAAPLHFPTTLSQPQTRGWSGNFGVHNKKEWVGEG